MARCNCNGATCGCRIIAGDGVEVTGSGQPNDPYIVSAEGGAGASGWFPGDMKAVATPTVPGGWLLCNGQAVSRTSYADLFAAIGSLYGNGNGTTTFNVPDMRNRTVVGASTTKPLGSGAGSETITLTTGQLPPHVHSIAHNHAEFNTGTGGAHKHLLDMSNEEGTNNDRIRRGGGHVADSNGAVESTGTHAHTVNVPAYTGNSGTGNGDSDPVSVMQPYRALNWLIKT